MAQVVVGCKLPNGLHIHLDGKEVTLNGSNSSRVIGGYGLTNVDESFITAWLAAHQDFPAVRAGLIFVQVNAKKAEDEADEKVDVKSGLEGIDPEKPGGGVTKAKDDK